MSAHKQDRSMHEALTAACAVKNIVDGTFDIVDSDFYLGLKEKPVFVPFVGWKIEGTDPRVEHILRTSFAMYQVFSSHYAAMQRLLSYMDGLRIAEDDPIRQQIEQLGNSILLIQQAAREGLDSTAAKIIKEQDSKNG